jgi:hypothetical protein
MELESREGGREPAPPGPATVSVPIPLVAVDEEFELEKPYDIPTTSIGKASAVPAAPTPTAAPTPMAPPTPSVPDAAEDQEFELEAPHEAPSSAWVASIRPLPVPEAPPSVAPTPMAAATPTAPPRSPASPAAPTSALISPTLGELYFNQGFTDKAIEVYRELTVQEPGNERLRARLRELEKLQSALAGGEPAPAVPTPTAADSAEAHRRQAIERTIVRLEGLLSAIRKG